MPLSLFPLVNFPNEITATTFSILFIIILIAELRILLRNKSSSKDKNSLPLILMAIFLPLIITIALSYSNIGQLTPELSHTGILILISGFLLRQYSIKTLGKFFIPVVGKQKNQKIVKTGPYKYIRHPSYLGLFLELLGTALALTNWIAMLNVIIFFLPTINYRIKVEEKFLSNQFKSYPQYKQKTKKLIPFIY
jgi:protein-S-isoprenylcysteine O-methyltransferase Ste14